VTIGSAAKLAILVAAFQLRTDVRKLLTARPTIPSAGVRHELFTELSKPGGPFVGLPESSMPFVDTIFDPASFGDPSKIDFQGMVSGGAPVCGINTLKEDLPNAKFDVLKLLQTIDDMPDPEDRIEKWQHVVPLPFAHRLWMTIRWSDQVAATTCLKDLGFDYINAVMRRSGLQDSSGKGLRIYETFGNLPDNSSGIDARYSPKTWRNENPLHGATARSLAALLVAIMRPDLVKPEDFSASASAIKSFLRTLWYTRYRGLPNWVDAPDILGGGSHHTVFHPGTRSYIHEILAPHPSAASLFGSDAAFDDVLSKLGLLKLGSSRMQCDVAYIEGRAYSGKTVRAGVIVLNYWGSEPNPATSTATRFEQCVEQLVGALI
jgi:hypothetical protein